MRCFETIKLTDSVSGIKSWRAYFSYDYIHCGDGFFKIRPNAPSGYGDTELEAIADLCSSEDERIQREADKEEREKRYLAARYAPITEEEWEALHKLYWEGGDLVFYDTRPLERLQERGYVTGIRFDGPRVWDITAEGKDYYLQYCDLINTGLQERT